MKRTDIVMTDELKAFLDFDLGHMNEEQYTNKIKDVVYFNDLKLDIYYPDEEKEKYPVFVILFGGGWISGFKEDKYVDLMLKPLKYGFACVVPDYTLSLDACFPQSVIDCKMAIDFVHKHADEYKFDDSHISVWGESAGGHLGLETGLVPNELLGLEGIDTSIRDLIIFYPLTNIETADKNCPVDKPKQYRRDSVFGVYLGKNFDDPKMVRLSAPVHFVSEKMPALWLQHGLADTLVYPSQSEELIKEVKKYPEVRFHHELNEGLVHADDWYFSDENIRRIVEFVNEDR